MPRGCTPVTVKVVRVVKVGKKWGLIIVGSQRESKLGFGGQKFSMQITQAKYIKKYININADTIHI